MANTKTKKVEEGAVAEVTAPSPASEQPKKKAVKVTLDTMVDVASCVYGELIWVSPKTGYTIIWNEFGETNPMSVSDLIDMRNGTRAFFERNWVTIESPIAEEVMKYLQVDRFYKSIKSTADLMEVFTYEPEDVGAIISNLSDTMKEVFARYAAQRVKTGELDSNAMINAISTATGYNIR